MYLVIEINAMLLPPFIAASDFINMNGTIFCEYFLDI